MSWRRWYARKSKWKNGEYKLSSQSKEVSGDQTLNPSGGISDNSNAIVENENMEIKVQQDIDCPGLSRRFSRDFQRNELCKSNIYHEDHNIPNTLCAKNDIDSSSLHELLSNDISLSFDGGDSNNKNIDTEAQLCNFTGTVFINSCKKCHEEDDTLENRNGKMANINYLHKVRKFLVIKH